MPNYCENTLEVVCSQELFDSVVSPMLFMAPLGVPEYPDTLLNGKRFSFRAFLPTPSDLQGLSAPARIVTESERIGWLRAKENGEHPFGGAPITQEMYDEFLSKYGFTDWYFWQIHHWGTKWDADVYNLTFEEKENTFGEDFVQLRVNFNTAWSPPTEWFDRVTYAILDKGVYMELRYSEEGLDFAGTHYFDAGERWDAEGRIYMIQDSTGLPITYDQKSQRWRNENGHFVSDDDIRSEVEYDSQSLC